jgi:hypothetical protein
MILFDINIYRFLFFTLCIFPTNKNISLEQKIKRSVGSFAPLSYKKIEVSK